MVEDAQEKEHWSLTAVGMGIWLVAISALLLGVSSCEAARIDPEDLCAGDGRGRCTMSPGTVRDVDSDEVTVLYNDESWRMTLAGGDAPAVGSRVRFEWWEGRLVALYDVTRRRRYRTSEWPTPWHPVVFVCFVPGIAALGVGGVAQLIRKRG